MPDSHLYKLEVYIPDTHLEQVKSAMFEAGAGRVGDYECCAWQTQGQGQYRPLAGASPHIGERGSIETVAEFKVEMVCAAEFVESVVQAMKSAHPYEEVAYSVIALENI